jgi:hypothetical protein
MLSFSRLESLFKRACATDESPFVTRCCGAADTVPKRRLERGAGSLKAIVWTLVLVMGIYVAIKVVPTLVGEYEFQDGIQTIARYASANRQNLDQVRKAVLEEATKDDLPLTAEDIHVEGSNGNVRINADYSIIIDLKVYQWTLNFHPAASNDALY